MKDHLEFSAEPLENRRMLAGNVTATINAAGDLVVNGDGQSNHIFVRRVTNGQVTTQIEGALGTTINGTSIANLEVPTRDIKINLRGGDNTLKMFKMTGIRKTIVRSGSGNDLLDIESTGTEDLRISTSGGSDLVRFQTSGATKQRVRTGSGDDLVISSSSLFTQADVNTGSGRDTFFSNMTTYIDDFKLRLGGGDDLASSVNDTFGADVLVDGGGNTDELLGAYPGADSSIAGEFDARRFEITTLPANVAEFTGTIIDRLEDALRYDDLLLLP